jgi:preprotein translocase subunit YajC
MKIDPATKQQIIKNALLSLFIYVLPIALMFITFSITGQRPWEKKAQKKENVKSITNKTNLNNGSND